MASDYRFLPGGFDDVSQPRDSGCTGISHRGVLLVGSAEVWFGFWLGIAYTCLVCFLSNSRGSNATEILWGKIRDKSLGKTNCRCKLNFHSRHQNYIGKTGNGDRQGQHIMRWARLAYIGFNGDIEAFW